MGLMVVSHELFCSDACDLTVTELRYFCSLLLQIMHI